MHAKSAGGCGRHSEPPNYPTGCNKDDHEYDGSFHQLRHSRAETRDGPPYANGSKHEGRSEYEREIEYATFQNLHDVLLLPSSPSRALEQDLTVRPNWGHSFRSPESECKA